MSIMDDACVVRIPRCWGGKEIGRVIGRDERQTFHLLQIGEIKCARRVGGRWCAGQSRTLARIRRLIRGLTNGAGNATDEAVSEARKVGRAMNDNSFRSIATFAEHTAEMLDSVADGAELVKRHRASLERQASTSCSLLWASSKRPLASPINQQQTNQARAGKRKARRRSQRLPGNRINDV